MGNQSIRRAAQILSLFSAERPQMKVSQIAKDIGLPVATAHGLVRALEECRFLAQDPATREYRLGMQLHVLASVQLGALELNQKAAGPVRYLAKDTELAVRVGVLDGTFVLLTLRTFPSGGDVLGNLLGVQVPSHCSSIGRAILAFMDDDERSCLVRKMELTQHTSKTLIDREALLAELSATRERGYSLVQRELMPHLSSVGAPIFGPAGKVVAGIALSGDPERIGGLDGPSLARKVMETAAEISSYMGHRMGRPLGIAQ